MKFLCSIEAPRRFCGQFEKQLSHDQLMLSLDKKGYVQKQV